MDRVAGWPLRIVSAAEARSCIARSILGAEMSPQLGTVMLRSHQVEAVRLLERAIARYGGAILCDPVGTGKTFVALAIAAKYRRLAVVAPAVLRPMWQAASDQAGAAIHFVSHESLSRNPASIPAGGLLIVDEAHHARNRATQRFDNLARLACGRDVLMLTATPVHNRLLDLESLLSLFLGDHVHSLSPSDIADVVVRRDGGALRSGIPDAHPIQWIEMPSDESIVELILGLPPPLPVRDGGEAGVLIRHSLVRQWSSSDAALRNGLQRRHQRAESLILALEAGTYPSRSELTAWAIGDDAVQLAFPELVATSAGNVAELLPVIRSHAAAVRQLLSTLPRDSERDVRRARAIQEIRDRHPGSPVVAFSQYEETIGSMFRLLAGSGGVAALSGRGGRVAGGKIPRRQVIERFAPRASRVGKPSEADAVSLLLTTDLLSEGVNLQDAGVVIHLDLPFTNARIDQRLGRIARSGSYHSCVWSYAFRPPATAETVARIEQILDVKLSLEMSARSSAGAADELRNRIRSWTGEACEPPVVAAVGSSEPGFLALVRVADTPRLLARNARRLDDDPLALLEAIDIATGPDAPVDSSALEAALREIDHHFAAARSIDDASVRNRRKIQRRITSMLRRTRLHDRWRVAPLAGEARQSAARVVGAHLDGILASLADSPLTGDAWLREVIRCARGARDPAKKTSADPVAIVLFVAHR